MGQEAPRRARSAASIALALGASLAACAVAAPLSGGGFVQAGPKLTGQGEHGRQFGGSVAISGDGTTALIGATDYSNDNGAAWVFVRSGSTWKQQGPKLAGSTGSNFGSAVALSANGDTALVTESIGVGHVWVYVRSGSRWARQAELIGRGAQADSEFGTGLALSGDGNTALVGDPLDHHDVGAVWLFTRTGSTWKPGPSSPVTERKRASSVRAWLSRQTGRPHASAGAEIATWRRRADLHPLGVDVEARAEADRT